MMQCYSIGDKIIQYILYLSRFDNVERSTESAEMDGTSRAQVGHLKAPDPSRMGYA